MIVGPALGGIVVSSLGLGWAYGIDVATYVFALGFAFMLHPQLPHRVTEEMERGWSAVKEGLRYLRGKRILQSTFRESHCFHCPGVHGAPPRVLAAESSPPRRPLPGCSPLFRLSVMLKSQGLAALAIPPWVRHVGIPPRR
jgi:hypothetical protein